MNISTMRLKTQLFMAVLVAVFSINCIHAASKDPLEGRIPCFDKRYATFNGALSMMKERNVKIIVETGTSRCGDQNCFGDGCSTMILGQWAHQNNAALYTVDIDCGAIQNAAEASQAYADNIFYFCQDSITFLKNFKDPIDFLYLDSYDFDVNNPTASQLHHYKEIVAAYDKLHENSIVMIDDCALPYGGKGKLVIDYLLSKGWKIVMSSYQVIMTQQ